MNHEIEVSIEDLIAEGKAKDAQCEELLGEQARFRKAVADLSTALEWYEERAEKLGSTGHSLDYKAAVLTEVELDRGVRAAAARTAHAALIAECRKTEREG